MALKKHLFIGFIVFCFFESIQASVDSLLEQNLQTRLTQYQGLQPDFSTTMEESLAYNSNQDVSLWYKKAYKNLLNTEDLNHYEQNFFWNTFDTVASNPAGRNLLYRILIEEKRGTLEQNILQAYDKSEAQYWQQYRKENLSVRWDPQHFSINPFKGYLNFNDTTCTMQFCKGKTDFYYTIGTMQSDISADLFHELLHWYHALHHPLRYYKEKLGFDQPVENIVRQSPFCQAIWAADEKTSNDQIFYSMKAWPQVQNDDTQFKTLDLEEIRTILGTSPSTMPFVYGGESMDMALNGDELNENLYRLYAKLPYRFGYEYFNYYEDRCVIDRCLDWTTNCGNDEPWPYLADGKAYWENSLQSFDQCTQKGIGYFRLPQKRLCFSDQLENFLDSDFRDDLKKLSLFFVRDPFLNRLSYRLL